jgi:acetolactate synthase-1/2/3 large subunit
METASEIITESTSVFVDTGCSVAWLMQAWRNTISHRIYHDCNNTAMGWALPAGIGFATANPSSNALIIVGDGSLMMSLQDLSALPNFKSKLKIMILNNGGYSMIKQTQEQWFGGMYFSSDAGSDLNFPNFRLIADAFGIDYLLIDHENTLRENLKVFLNSENSMFCEVIIDSNARVNPQVKFGKTIENMEPELMPNYMEELLAILKL